MARRALRADEAAHLRRIVGAYLAFQVFTSANFFWPIFVVYYQRFGRLELSAILGLQAFYTAVRVALDVPLGLLADRFGRRPALVGSAALLAAGCAVIVSDSSLVTFYVAELLFAGAVAAQSGADSALLFDSLARFGQEEDYLQVEGRAQSFAAFASAASALASGLLIEIWLPLPYLLTLIAASASLVAATLLDEPARRAAAPQRALGLARHALREVLGSPAVLWLVALSALLIVLSHVVFYLQQPYLEWIGVPVWLFGAVVAGTKLVHGAVARRAGAIEARLSAGRMPAFLVVAGLSPVALMAVVAWPVGAVFVLLRGVADGLLAPVLNFYLNRLVADRTRASVLSIASFVAHAAQAAVLAGFAALLVHVSLAGTLRLAAFAGAVLGALLLAVPRRSRRAATLGPSLSSPGSLRTRDADR